MVLLCKEERVQALMNKVCGPALTLQCKYR